MTRSLVSASMYPRRCSSASTSSIDRETSTASTSCRSTGVSALADRCRRHRRQGAYKRRPSLHARLLSKDASIAPVRMAGKEKRRRKTPGVRVDRCLRCLRSTDRRRSRACAVRSRARGACPGRGHRAGAPAWRLQPLGGLKATGRRRSAGEIGASVAHRAAVARAGRRAAIATATATATAAIAAAATAAAIATATAAAAVTAAAATAVTAAAATAVGRTRTTRTEAAAIATAATAAAAKSTAAAATTGLAFDGFTDRDRAAIEQRTVHGLHGRGALIVGFHFEEREAAAAAGLAIRDHFRRADGPELGERFGQTLGRDRVGQIAHKQFATHSRLCAGGRVERSPARACWTTVSKRFVDR